MVGNETYLVNIGGTHEGHRGQYAQLFATIIQSHETPLTSAVMLANKPIVFSMIEEAFARYTVISLLRSCLGRRTAGILFRPLPAVQAASWKLKVKRAALTALNRLPGVATVVIMPFDVEPGFARIARGWMYDPQFWDQHFDYGTTVGPSDGALTGAIRQKAGHRKIVSAIGRQDKGKGFAQFVQLYRERADLREQFLFVSCGRIAPEIAHLVAEFEEAGGMVFDQFITDAEINDLYAISDLIWCCYDVQYDQASGIFGRAMQFGVPVVVRRNSLIHKFSEQNDVKFLVSAEPIAASDFSQIPDREPPQATEARARAMADLSIGALRRMLGLAPYDGQREGY